MKNITGLVIAIGCLVALSLGCGKGDPHKYPTGVSDNFVNSCKADGSVSKEVCSCIFEKVQAKYTYDEFYEMDKKADKGAPPPDFIAFASKARSECSAAK